MYFIHEPNKFMKKELAITQTFTFNLEVLRSIRFSSLKYDRLGLLVVLNQRDGRRSICRYYRLFHTLQVCG